MSEIDRDLLRELEDPNFLTGANAAHRRQVILNGVLAWGEYWPGLSISWLEQGAQVDGEIGKGLFRLSRNSSVSQALRHRSNAVLRKFLSGQKIEELDVVRIVHPKGEYSAMSGTLGVARAPLDGDYGTVVHVHVHEQIENVEPAFIVECINDEGYTLWVEDFFKSELQLACKHHLADT
jgi:hypothetical protein